MLFNSLEFAVFLPICLLIYRLLCNVSTKDSIPKLWLLATSYYFYSAADWRFLFLLFYSSLSDFILGRLISGTAQASYKKYYLALSIISNLGVLAFFKYFDFFVDNIAATVSLFGYSPSVQSLNLVLPVGISFYTFQTLSYTIDIYRKRITPEKNLLNFLVFVSFFPQLVAGPIERAKHLLPQLKKIKTPEYQDYVSGARQILWGLCQKIILADTCAIFADSVYSNYLAFSGSTMLLAAIFFLCQIYGDFAGYSNIAIGSARLFGIRLSRNFVNPFFAFNVRDFWRKWHVSLSSWFKDYVYKDFFRQKLRGIGPMGAVLGVFLISGLWHGANWTFIMFGLINGMGYVGQLYIQKYLRKPVTTLPRNAYQFSNWILAMGVVCLSFIFFRCETVEMGINYTKEILSLSIFAKIERPYTLPLILTCTFFLVEWLGRKLQHPLNMLINIPSRTIRWGIYYVLIFTLYHFGAGDTPKPFIYFQF